MNRRLVWCTMAITLSGVAAQAHHAITAVYDMSRKVTIEGVVAQFQFIHPHPFVTIDVTGGDGTTVEWRLEMDNRRELAAIGMSRDTLKAGDQVVVAGSPGRTDPRSLYIRRLDRPADGFRYEQVGNTPKIRAARARAGV